MAFTFIAHRGTANNKAAGTTITVAPTATLAVDAVIVVRCTSDNGTATTGETTSHSVSDSAGNTWTKIREWTIGTATDDGVTCSLWVSKLSVAIPTSGTVQLVCLGGSKVISLVEFSIPFGEVVFILDHASATGTGTAPSVSLFELELGAYLFLGAIGIEGPNEDAFTQDPNFLNNASDGTTAGTSETNVAQRFGTRSRPSAVSETYNPTLGTSRDWVAILGALQSDLPTSTAPLKRRGRVSWAELDIPLAPRRGQLSFAELEAPLTARQGQVSWAETEVPLGPRQGQLSWAELELPLAPRRGQLSWAELENPLGPRRGQVSWAEGEVPLAPRRGALSWSELELPLAPRRGQLSWAEAEAPDAGQRAQVSLSELELPLAPRRSSVSWFEVETPTGPRRGQLSQLEFEIPLAPRRVQTSWVELETPLGARRGQVSWAELEVPILGLQPRRARVSSFHLQLPVFQRIRFAAVRTIFTLDAQRLNLLPLDIPAIFFCTDTRRVFFYNPEDDTFNQVIL